MLTVYVSWYRSYVLWYLLSQYRTILYHIGYSQIYLSQIWHFILSGMFQGFLLRLREYIRVRWVFRESIRLVGFHFDQFWVIRFSRGVFYFHYILGDLYGEKNIILFLFRGQKTEQEMISLSSVFLRVSVRNYEKSLYLRFYPWYRESSYWICLSDLLLFMRISRGSSWEERCENSQYRNDCKLEETDSR